LLFLSADPNGGAGREGGGGGGHLVKIGLHEFEDDIYVLEFSRAGREHDVLYFNYVCNAYAKQSI
jgi:hypothetical protein